MTLPLHFQADVEADVQAAYRWHEQAQPGLGRDFLSAVQSRLTTIADTPLIYGVLRLGTRAAPLSGFSYVVYYRVLRNRILVVAIHHTSRDPAAWQSRK